LVWNARDNAPVLHAESAESPVLARFEFMAIWVVSV
jgi:hypothetical protein